VNAAVRILAAGPGVTLQDGGRHGALRFGVTPAGPMDRLAFATANRAVGALPDAPALEVALGGLELTVEGDAVSLAVVGGAFRLALDGRALASPALIRLSPPQRLAIRAGAQGAWCYVAVAGQIAIPPVLGSVSTHTRSGLGGLRGRALAAGDGLPVMTPRSLDPAFARITAPWLDRPGDVIRVMLGPQDDYFAADQIAAFLQGPWTLSNRSDRMAYLLDGPPLVHAKGFNIVSDGIALGAIQIPGNGHPMVLMADRQPTGGYPKIANVIGADVGGLAQLQPGARFRFRAVTIEEAIAARRQEALALTRSIALEPLTRTDLSSEFLLGLNLIDGISGGET
jgi:5-oxoprolinase (ATP-hydrolysing) subunit C